MRIFLNLSAHDHYDTIQYAALAVRQRAQKLSLGTTAWSLAELHPDEEDYLWLLDWAQHLPTGVASRCLIEGQARSFSTSAGQFSYAAALGTLLLFLISEIARREANERRLWSFVRQGYFSSEVKALLFIQGHPTRSHKDVLEQAARWLNLRHVFDIEGLQHWYDTVYLQFGFTEQGFARRLAEWLYGFGQTQAISRLLDTNGRMYSPKFQELWDTLQNLRRKNIGEQQARASLQGNPWILPSWIADLLQATRKVPVPVEAEGERIETIDEAPPFLDSPTLVWNPPREPHFSCRVINLAHFDLTDDLYQIVVAGWPCGQIRKNADGSYHAPQELILPTSGPNVLVQLISTDEQVHQSQLLTLWEANDEIALFYTRSGQRLGDAWNTILRTSQSYLLLVTSDLTITPSPVRYYRLRPEVTLYYLAENWSPRTQVFLQEHLLWQPAFASAPASVSRPALHSITLYPRKAFHFGEQFQLIVTHSNQDQILYLRAAGHSLGFTQKQPGKIVTDWTTLTPALFSGTEPIIEVIVGAKSSASTVISRLSERVHIPVQGAVALDEGGWAVLDTEFPLTTELAERRPMKFFAVERYEWFVMEQGKCLLNGLSAKPCTLPALAGRGAPLILQRGLYNAIDKPIALVKEIIDHGCLHNVAIDGQARLERTLCLYLSSPIEPSEKHRIIWWDQQGTIAVLTPECAEIVEHPAWWLVTIPPYLTSPLALAISDAGFRLGSWWSKDWTSVLQSSVLDTFTIALLLRWFYLPLLSWRSLEAVRRFAWTSPAPILMAWITERDVLVTAGDSFTLKLQGAHSDYGWLAVVRNLFDAWNAPPGTASLLLDRLFTPDEDMRLDMLIKQVALSLLRISPLLMGQIIRQWCHEIGLPQWGPLQTRALLDSLIGTIAGTTRSDELGPRKQKLYEDVQGTRDIDPAFINKSLLRPALALFEGRAITEIERNNLAIATYEDPFRRLLGTTLLECVKQNVR